LSPAGGPRDLTQMVQLSQIHFTQAAHTDRQNSPGRRRNSPAEKNPGPHANPQSRKRDKFRLRYSEIVAHALMRAVSPLLATPVFTSQARQRHESHCGTHECVRHNHLLRSPFRAARIRKQMEEKSGRHWTNPSDPRKPPKPEKGQSRPPPFSGCAKGQVQVY